MATISQLHMAMRGVRGPVEFDLDVDKSPGGNIRGVITLTKVQIDTLRLLPSAAGTIGRRRRTSAACGDQRTQPKERDG